MKLILCQLPDTLRGIYGKNKDILPERFLYAHPDLARAILKMEDDGVRLRYSDIFRSAEASLQRRKQFEAKGGPQLAKRPGESPHNWGLAVDIDVDDALKTLNLKSKADLDALLRSYGLYCHRLDGRLGSEAWHYNALGPDAEQWLKHASPNSTSRAVEAKIQALYAGEMKLSRVETIASLKKAGFLKGTATSDNVESSVRAFQKFWGLAVDGIAGPKTQRLLSYVTAERILVDA